jgi:hypothetical protein
MAVAVLVVVGCPAVDTRSSLLFSCAYLSIGECGYINLDVAAYLQ